MTDDRPPADEARPPVPQFGEYASPEEQRRRMQANPLPTPPAPSVPPAPAAPVPVLGGSARAGLGIDRVITIALLVYGLINTIASIPQMADYVTYSETLLAMMGIDATLTDPSSGRGWGVAAAIVIGLGWLATAALAYLRMRAGRLAFWVPVVGAIVFLGISGVLLAIPLLGDPAILDAVTGA